VAIFDGTLNSLQLGGVGRSPCRKLVLSSRGQFELEGTRTNARSLIRGVVSEVLEYQGLSHHIAINRGRAIAVPSVPDVFAQIELQFLVKFLIIAVVESERAARAQPLR
jgi:hypothetical protein